MVLSKPPSVAKDPVQSARWDEVTAGRDFQPYDVPALTLLCTWYAIIDKCMEDLQFSDGLRVAYANDLSDIKAFPQINTIKQASAEIRQLNKQLGIYDGRDSEAKEAAGGASELKLILGKSLAEDGLSGAEDQGRAAL